LANEEPGIWSSAANKSFKRTALTNGRLKPTLCTPRDIALSQFRFVQIVIVIILGLGLTEILRNLGGQIRRRSEIEVYPLQIFASCLLLFFILTLLWAFSLSLEVTWNFPLFLLKVMPTIALAMSAQLIGLDFNSTRSSEQQYFENCRPIYLILASVPLFEVITTTVTAESLPITPEHLIELNIFRVVVAGVMASLGFIKKPAYHWSVLIGSFVVMFGWTSAIIFELKL
jgi:hypothetical protein